MDVLPQGRHFLQVVHHSFMFCGGRCAIIGGLKYNGSCAGVTLLAHQLGAALRFSGQFPYKANGHGRAMLAPTRVFRQSAPRVPIWEPSAFFISCFLIVRSTVSRALPQCTDHSHCFSTSFSLFKSSGLAICSFMPVFFASCTSSAKAFAVMAMMGTLPRLPASARIAAVAS